jgi:hypothetical protein
MPNGRILICNLVMGNLEIAGLTLTGLADV